MNFSQKILQDVIMRSSYLLLPVFFCFEASLAKRLIDKVPLFNQPSTRL